MFLKYRPVRPADLGECLLCLRDGFAHDASSKIELLALWRSLLSNGAANATLIEDLSRPPQERIVYFRIMVFISADYALHLKTEAFPHVSRTVLRDRKKGQCPLLSLGALSRDNMASGVGVTMLVLNSGSRPEIMADHEAWKLIGNKVAEYSLWAIGGYNLKETLIETYSEIEHAWAAGFGYRLRTNYLSVQQTNQLMPGTCLYGANAEEANLQVSSSILRLLQYEAPCFALTPAEQALLWSALSGDTDEELADQLGYAVVTLRKRWETVYQRVAEISPHVLGPMNGENKNRGLQKKRRILSYVQHHLEELRPVTQRKDFMLT